MQWPNRPDGTPMTFAELPTHLKREALAEVQKRLDNDLLLMQHKWLAEHDGQRVDH